MSAMAMITPIIAASLAVIFGRVQCLPPHVSYARNDRCRPRLLQQRPSDLAVVLTIIRTVDANLRIVAHLPLTELWGDDEFSTTARGKISH